MTKTYDSFRWLAHDENGQLHTTEELFSTFNLNSLLSLAHELCNAKFEQPFKVMKGHHTAYITTNKLGLRLKYAITQDYCRVLESFTGHTYAPQIKVILEKISKYEATLLAKTGESLIEKTRNLKYVAPDKCAEVAADFNNFAKDLRDALRDENMKEKIKSFERNARERSKQFLRGCESAFNRHSKCLSIRLDTTYRKKNQNDEDHVPETNEEFLENCKKIESHRELFIKHLHRTFRENLAFYSWKLEYGVTRGLHLHWFIILNGNKFQDRINIAFHLGEHWVNNITGGDGTYFNVSSRNSNGSNILRVVHHSETEAREHFERIANYLTKTDFLIKIALPGNMRSFGCSKSVKSFSAKRGRKRQSNDHKDHMPN